MTDRRPLGGLAFAVLLAACSTAGPSPSLPPGAAASPTEAPASASLAAAPSAVEVSPVATGAATSPGASIPPSLAPAGDRIVFDGGPAGLGIVALDGSAPVLIAGTKGAASPTCTPDGARIAFADTQIFAAAIDGTGLTQLTHFKTVVADVPALTANGKRVAFLAFPPSGDAAMAKKLWVLAFGGSATAVSGVAPSGDRPAWRPDGGAITYANANNGGLAQVTIPSGTVSQLTTDDDSFAAWAPDGKTLAFERGVALPDGTEQHHIYLLHNGTVTQVTTGSADDEFPAWSPDGAWIAFTRFVGTHPAALFRVRPDGTGTVKIPTPGFPTALWPCWVH